MPERLHQDEFMRPGRRVRIVREPALTGAEALAFALVLIMVCGPLAFGAFGL